MALALVLLAACDQDPPALHSGAPSSAPSATPIVSPESKSRSGPVAPDSGVYAIAEQDPCVRRRPRYRKIPVEVEQDDPAVLTAAVRGLIDHWFEKKPSVGPRAANDIAVSIEGDRAVIDLLDRKHFSGFGTSCASSIFIGDMTKTALQFPTVSDVEFRYQGSCTDFFKAVEVGPVCYIYSLDDQGQVTYVRRKDS